MCKLKPLLVSLCVLYSHAASAEEIIVDPERLEVCLAQTNDPYACIGAGAGACSSRFEDAGLEGLNQCVVSEGLFWTDRQEAVFLKVEAHAVRIDKMNRGATDYVSFHKGLTAMQLGWAEMRDAYCFAAAPRNEIDDLIRRNQCLMRQNGEQAIYLQSFLDEYE